MEEEDEDTKKVERLKFLQRFTCKELEVKANAILPLTECTLMGKIKRGPNGMRKLRLIAAKFLR